MSAVKRSPKPTMNAIPTATHALSPADLHAIHTPPVSEALSPGWLLP